MAPRGHPTLPLWAFPYPVPPPGMPVLSPIRLGVKLPATSSKVLLGSSALSPTALMSGDRSQALFSSVPCVIIGYWSQSPHWTTDFSKSGTRSRCLVFKRCLINSHKMEDILLTKNRACSWARNDTFICGGPCLSRSQSYFPQTSFFPPEFIFSPTS